MEKDVDDTASVFGALLTSLSKAFDCIPYDLIVYYLIYTYLT